MVWVPREISPDEIHAIGALTSAVPIKKDTVKDIYPNDPDHYLDTYKILTTQFPAKNFELDGKERKKYEKYTGGIIFYTTVKKPMLR